MTRRILWVLLCLMLLTTSLGGSVAAAGDSPRAIRVVVSRNGFQPSVIEVAEGEQVAITFVYGDTDLDYPNPHMIKLKDYGLQTAELSPDHPQQTLTFTVNKTGSFSMACVAKCEGHQQLQDGIIKVGAGQIQKAEPSSLKLNFLPRSQGDPGYRLVALLKDAKGNPVPGATITFMRQAAFLPGQQPQSVKLGEAATDADGKAALTWVPRTAGAEQVGVSFAGTGTLLKAEASSGVQVNQATVQEYRMESRRLDLGGSNWPIWAILATVWSLYGFVIYQLTRLKRAAKGMAAPVAAPFEPAERPAPALASGRMLPATVITGIVIMGLIVVVGTNLAAKRALSSSGDTLEGDTGLHERLLNAATDLATYESTVSARTEQLAKEVVTLAERTAQLSQAMVDVAEQVKATQSAVGHLGDRLGAVDRQIASLDHQQTGAAPMGGTAPAAGAFEVKVEAYSFGWDPKEIVVPLGKQVRLVVHNNEDRSLPGLAVSGTPLSEHGFGIEAYSIDVKVGPGETQVVEFVADKAGEFPVECTVWCGTGKLPDGSRVGHPSMTAMLIVR